MYDKKMSFTLGQSKVGKRWIAGGRAFHKRGAQIWSTLSLLNFDLLNGWWHCRLELLSVLCTLNLKWIVGWFCCECRYTTYLGKVMQAHTEVPYSFSQRQNVAITLDKPESIPTFTSLIVEFKALFVQHFVWNSSYCMIWTCKVP